MNEMWEEQAARYVLDELEARERTAFESQLREDPQLAAYVRELQHGLSAAVRNLPAVPVPSALLSAIEARIDALPAHQPAGLTRWAVFRWAFLGGLAAVLVALMGGLAVWRFRPAVAAPRILVAGLGPERSAMEEVPLTGSARTPDARFIRLATLAEHYWDNPATLPVNSADSSAGGSGYAVYDPQSRQGFVAIRGVPTTTSQERYHLWVYDRKSGHLRDAGVLPLASGTRGLFFFSIDDPALRGDGALNFFITAEAGDERHTTPAGKVVLGSRPL